MKKAIKNIIISLLFLSFLSLFITIVSTTKNTSFNVAGNIFTGSNSNHKKQENKDITLSDIFWTSGRFLF